MTIWKSKHLWIIASLWLLPLVMLAFRPENAANNAFYADFVTTFVALLGALQVFLACLSTGFSIAIGRQKTKWRPAIMMFFERLTTLFVMPFAIFCGSFALFHERFTPDHGVAANMAVGALLFGGATISMNAVAFVCAALAGNRSATTMQR